MADGRPPRSFETPGDQYGINTRIMLTAVISLFFVVVIVVLLHLYARCVLRRQARSRATIRQFSLEVAASQANASEPPKTGLDPSVIASLPIIVYKQADRVNEPALECAVCLSAFEEEEMARLLPNCKHSFHVQCIDMWLDSHSTCPICRTGAEPRARMEMGEPGGVVVVAGSEGTSESAAVPALKASGSGMASGSGSRLSSFRRMLSRERSERRSQVSGQGHGGEDIERQ